ncbi:MBL fold metallo-hydrolase [uncultured Roseobacter sp.]|uniref:MBL fold metallo-hydrolase n=1 Tax=uncultured Roseobacter sp. TaxID=114847 RepID=UPI0026197142|nr:MBL fold metallo-hydrolase [uncultured Roseobacter sp.]
MSDTPEKLLNRRSFLSSAATVAVGGAATTSLVLPAKADTPIVGAQLPNVYRRKLGNYEITVLGDGYLDLPHQIWAGLSPEQIDGYLDDAFVPTGSLRNGVNAYLINTGEKLILVDSGARDLFGPNAGLLPGNLAAIGVSPEDIDEVLITHVHPDHVAGLYTADGRITVPNAEILVDEADLNFWISEAGQAQAIDIAKPWFDIARDWKNVYDGRIRTFRGETDFGDGISSFPLPGHTPGHTGLRIESAGETLLILGDAVISAAVQFANPDASAIWDTNAEEGKKSRRTIFDVAARDRTLVTATHLPFPSFGYVDRRADGSYRWVPEEWRYAT